MLKKSKKSAFIMACIFLLCGIITRIVGEWISGFETGVYDLILRYQAEGEIIIVCMIFVPIFLIAAGIVSLFIYGRNNDHFGKWGALRWSMVGVIYGILKVGIDQLVSIIGMSGIGGLVEDLLGFLAIVVSYFVVFMGPQAKKMFAGVKPNAHR